MYASHNNRHASKATQHTKDHCSSHVHFLTSNNLLLHLLWPMQCGCQDSTKIVIAEYKTPILFFLKRSKNRLLHLYGTGKEEEMKFLGIFGI